MWLEKKYAEQISAVRVGVMGLRLHRAAGGGGARNIRELFGHEICAGAGW